MIASQRIFNSLDLLSADTRIADGNYNWMINARNRFGYVEPIKSHLLIEGKPPGKLQGVYAVGNILIIFVAGKAYLQEDGVVGWAQIANFQMSVDAPQYWMQAVPASGFNFTRKSATNIKAPITVSTDFEVAGTPSAIVVQDGVSQPWLIIYDTVNQLFTSRECKKYADWANVSNTLNDREYVPIGKQMMFLDQILFIVAPDNKSCYRSITGRALDFMVNVDTNGNKAASESIGGAASVSFAFDYDDITCIQAINIPDSFVYGTARNTRIIALDFLNLIFGEPTFRVSAKLPSGIVNQYCLVDILGDYATIDFDGVKSFDAVEQLRFRGRNSIFSLMISKLIKENASKKIKQRNPIAVSFDDYAIFNLDTRYGNLLCIYDTLAGRWVSFDITELSNIKQFAVIETLTESKLYAITEFDELYQVFGGTTTESAIIRTKAFTASEPLNPNEPALTTSVEHKGASARLMFNSGTVEGTVTLIELVDGQESTQNRETKTLQALSNGLHYPIRPPVIPSSSQQVDNPTFSLTSGLNGKKISYILIWDNDAQFLELEVITSNVANQVNSRQMEQTYSK